MAKLSLFARHAPIFLLAILGGTGLIVCNPGYFWDDWVWLFQSSASNIQIGRELGVWWGGYLTNLINGLPSPAFAMRGVALVSWVVTGGAIGYVLRVREFITSREAVQLLLIYCATHVVPVRFVTSVAMYNVYIASFWIGCALLVSGPRSFALRCASLLFFFISFYLNSLIVLYGLLIALMVLDELRQDPRVTASFKTPHAEGGWKARLKALADSLRLPLRAFAVRNVAFLVLPFAFVAVKKFTTAASPLYGSYNAIDRRLVVTGVVDSFTLIRPVLRDFFATSSRTVTPLAIVIATIVCFALLRLLPKSTTRTPWRKIFAQLSLGLVLFAAAVYPYVVVGKAPDLTSFYDARNILPAVAGLDLILIALVNVVDRGFACVPFLRTYGRDLLLGYIIGASICAGFISGVGLWRDWMRQSASMHYLSTHRAETKDASTFVFNDSSTDSRYRGRMLWNYEYTGNLITVFGGRSRFGISVGEYFSLPPNAALLINPYMRQRFNIADYDFTKPHVIVTIRDGTLKLNTKRTLAVIWTYLNGGDWIARLPIYFHVDIAREFIETDERVHEMYRIAKALAAYRADHGVYPTLVPMTKGQLSVLQISATGRVIPAVVTGDIPGLFPQYMARPATMVRNSSSESNYLYISDGQDYKLVYANAPDEAYAKQAHPALFDSVRGGYGVWTADARAW